MNGDNFELEDSIIDFLIHYNNRVHTVVRKKNETVCKKKDPCAKKKTPAKKITPVHKKDLPLKLYIFDR